MNHLNGRLAARASSRRFGLMLALVMCAVVAPISAQGRNVVIKGAHLITMAGDDIAEGSVVISNGKIVAVGAEVDIPYDARVIDAKGMVVMPGLVEPMTSQGIDRPNENIDVAPFLQVADAIDPSDRYYEERLRQGVTSVHVSQGNNCVVGGVSRVVRPIGLSPPEMTVLADVGLKIAIGPKSGYDRAVQMAVLREAFADLDRYKLRLAERLYGEEQKKKGEEVRIGPKEAQKEGMKYVTIAKMDDKHRNLERLRQGRLDAYLWCPKAMDVGRALRVASEYGFAARATLVVGSEAYKAARALRKSKRPVILPTGEVVHTETDPVTLEIEETFVPGELAKRKVAFAIASAESPLYEAARLRRNGIDRTDALAAITLNAARAIGMEQRVGSLEKGKDGNVVILTGDPFDVGTWVDKVVIEGRVVYERNKDLRLRKLLEGVYRTEERAKKPADEGGRKAADEKPSEKGGAKKGDQPNRAGPQKIGKEGGKAPSPAKGKSGGGR